MDNKFIQKSLDNTSSKLQKSQDPLIWMKKSFG